MPLEGNLPLRAPWASVPLEVPLEGNLGKLIAMRAGTKASLLASSPAEHRSSCPTPLIYYAPAPKRTRRREASRRPRARVWSGLAARLLMAPGALETEGDKTGGQIVQGTKQGVRQGMAAGDERGDEVAVLFIKATRQSLTL